MPVLIDQAWELNDQVALRPEPFGALAYHYGNRRLTFLRAHELVTVVERLAAAPDVAGALAEAGVAEARHPAFLKALDALAAGDFIRRRPDETTSDATSDDATSDDATSNKAAA